MYKCISKDMIEIDDATRMVLDTPYKNLKNQLKYF